MEVKNINLALNENNNFIPDFLTEELKKELFHCNKYPSYIYEDVEKTIREKYSLDENYTVLLGNGLDEIIMILLIGLLSHSGKVLSSSNTFKGYIYAANALGIEVEEIPLENFRVNAKQIVRNINENIRAIIICNPHNPCGTLLMTEEIKEIIQVAKCYGVLVILDEAYIEYVLDENYKNGIDWLHDNKNLIVLRTFSKAFGLAGLRCGYAIYSVDILENIKEVVKALPFRVSRLACCAAKVCVKNSMLYLSQIKKINFIKSKIYTALDNRKLFYVKSETNFILIKFGKETNEICDMLLKKYNIRVRSCEEFGLEFYARVSIGTEEEMDKFIFALSEIVEEHENG